MRTSPLTRILATLALLMSAGAVWAQANVTGVAYDTDPVFEGDLTQQVSVTYDTAMDAASTPTITFTSGAWTAGTGSWATATVWTQTFTLTSQTENATVGVTVSGATSGGGTAQNDYTTTSASELFAVDNVKPTVDTVASDTDPVYESDLTVMVTVTFSEAMDTATDPTIDFSDGTWTSNGDGAWSNVDRTYTESFVLTDNDEEIADVTIDVSGAKDAAGNDQEDYTPEAEFDIDTVKPTITSIDLTPVAPATINDAAIPGQLQIAVTFSEAMGTSPSISFDPYHAETLSFNSGSYDVDNQVYTAIYDLSDNEVEVEDIDITVGNATDEAGNSLESSSTATDVIDIDTISPEAITNELTPVVYAENDPAVEVFPNAQVFNLPEEVEIFIPPLGPVVIDLGFLQSLPTDLAHDLADELVDGLGMFDLPTPMISEITVHIDGTDADDVLAAVGVPTSIEADYDSGTRTLTLSPATGDAAHLLEFEAALRAVTYANAGDNPDTTDRTATVVVTDAGDNSSDPVTRTIQVVAVDDPLDILVYSPILTLEDSPVPVLGEITDPDRDWEEDGEEIFLLTLTVKHGVLAALVDDDFAVFGDETETLSIAGSLEDLKDLWEGVYEGIILYVPDENFSGIDDITVSLTNAAPEFEPPLPPAPDAIIPAAEPPPGAEAAADDGIIIVLMDDTDDPPVAADDEITVLEDAAPTAIDVLDNDSDPDGNDFEVTAADDPSALGGDVSFDADSVTYEPAEHVNGTDTFSYTITDENGDTDTATVTVTITPVNDKPLAGPGAIVVLEDDSHIFVQSDFGFSDPTDSPSHNFNRVQITGLPAAGTLTYGGGAVVAGDYIDVGDLPLLVYTPNADSDTADSFTYKVEDDGGVANGGENLSDEATMTITVTTVNDAPDGTDNAVAVDEDTTYDAFTGASFGLTDANDDPANGLAAVKITTLPTAGTLELDGTPVAAADMIDAADITDLTFIPAADANGTPYATFTFQVQDDGGTDNGGVDLDPTPNTFTINVNSVNDAPAGTDKNVDLAEDQSYVFDQVDFGFTDPNDDPADAFLQVIIETDVSNGVLSDGGVAITSFPVTIAVGDIANLTYQPNADYNGPDSFTFTVVDDGAAGGDNENTDPSPNTFSFNVEAVNDVPTFSLINVPITGILEDSGAHSYNVSDDMDAGAADESGQTLDFIVSADDPDMFSAGPAIDATGELSFTLADDAAGTTTIRVRLHDDGGTANGGVDTSGEQTFTVTVTEVNDAPEGTDGSVTTLEDTTYTFTVADFGLRDPQDSPDDALAYVHIRSLATTGRIQLDGTDVGVDAAVSAADIIAGLLTYVPVANANGVPYASFTFQVQDDGGTDNGGIDLAAANNTMTINVTAVDDPPVAYGQMVETRKKKPVDIVLVATDIDTPAGTLVYGIAPGGEPDNGIVVGAGPNWTYTPDEDFVGTDTFTFRVFDGTSFSNEATVTIEVKRPLIFLDDSDDGCRMSAGARSWEGAIAWYLPFLGLLGFLAWHRRRRIGAASE